MLSVASAQATPRSFNISSETRSTAHAMLRVSADKAAERDKQISMHAIMLATVLALANFIPTHCWRAARTADIDSSFSGANARHAVA
eukprot:9454082-Pyramimonas_sp.AAC.1